MTLQDGLRSLLAGELRAAGLSQAEAARQLGITAKHMSQMLTGRAPLSLAWADEIAGLCGRALLVGSRPASPEASGESR
ncbi:helix-turn-helix transcriptional regulator [Nonomuraea turkmeniaca]|uniref:Helix-turn-helix transcriptional regulator n=1 Tax=Nonomuraea turkmeniaca TaxID=103838 RepID=A0A5S4F4H4_9ACTN|nr:helix-turn-helix transcriptional regulator [Nonomuraea turkmeniaca]TMR11045.1 helix-turn-helix transcriptional regulator [Nonomuraea turkmeniaca]